MTDYNHGAFVQIDDTKLSRDGLVLRGMMMALDLAIADIMQGAQAQTDMGIRKALTTVAQIYTTRRDAVAVQLTKSALGNKSGVLEHIRKD